MIITSFTASWVGEDVIVEWETASELNNAGFYIQRSDNQYGVFIRITQFIPANGDPFSGAHYQFVDTNVASGYTYWYKLETIDLNQESEYYDPVSAVPPNLASTATATATQTPSATGGTPTLTFTPSPTLAVTPNTTLSPTATNNPSQFNPTATLRPPTAYPASVTPTSPYPPPPTAPIPPTLTPLPASVVLTVTEVVSPSRVLTSTATLLPLPNITLTFPAGGIIIQKHETVTFTPAPTRQALGVSGRSPVGGIMLLSVILLIWILLGVWFYLSFRRIE